MGEKNDTSITPLPNPPPASGGRGGAKVTAAIGEKSKKQG